jgi:hypothetical protein
MVSESGDSSTSRTWILVIVCSGRNRQNKDQDHQDRQACGKQAKRIDSSP